MAPLDGIRVIEAGLLVQGPQAAATLQEWGAAVTKVELPGIGDHARWLPVAPGDPRSAYFTACNRGKRSVTADLRTPDGREIFLRLVEQADVAITNFVPGTMEGWGLGYDQLAVRNPKLVYATGSTFGFRGRLARREGADLAGQAAGGLISTTGRRGGEPTPVGATIADHIASQNLVGGILAALLARERTGEGQAITTSLVGSQIWAQASEYTGYLLRGRPGGPANRSHPLIPGLYGIFPTADGWIAIVGVTEPERSAFFELLGRPELAERFPEPLYWDEDKAQLWPLLDEAFGTATTAEWCARLSDAGVRTAPLRDHEEVVADPDMWANGYLATVETPDGPRRVVAAPVAFGRTPVTPPGVTPELGQHTEEVLLELGYRWDDIARLRDGGVI